jgi:3-deoxy-manno-octulosonate cytidylyltransferase (CMP-KDO synthetase)
MKACIVIPARLKSTRLAEKLLLQIESKSMIQRVYERCKKSMIQDVFIACDDQKILNHCLTFTDAVWLTSTNCQSGTERIVESLEKLKHFDLVINVQGDEPLIDIQVINNLFICMQNSSDLIGTCIKKCADLETFNNPNKVKVVQNKNRKALYFSRSPIPYPMAEGALLPDNVYIHLGIYAYKIEFLKQFNNLNDSLL